MKFREVKSILIFTSCSCAAAWAIFPLSDVFAAGEITSGRKIWDNVMLWVNFGILAFLFIKYARKPLIDFLKNASGKTQDELNELSELLDSARSEKDAEEERLANIAEHIREIRERIFEVGRKEKENIVEQGRITAKKMIEDAEEYSKHRMALAKKSFSDEMVDLAIEMVKDRLESRITEEDEIKLTEQFISNLDVAKTYFE